MDENNDATADAMSSCCLPLKYIYLLINEINDVLLILVQTISLRFRFDGCFWMLLIMCYSLIFFCINLDG